MAERIPWWKAFLPRKKTGSTKDSASAPVYGPDFNPFADKSKDGTASRIGGDQTQNQTQNQSHSQSESSNDTYDDSQLESVFNEQTCRRNMKVSRSGRFKEKRRVRSTLPIQERETESVAATAGREDRW